VAVGIHHSPLVEHFPVSDNRARIDDQQGYGGGHCCTRDKLAKVRRSFFFHRTQVRVGSTMTLAIPPALVPAILPRDVASKVPFSNLADVLAKFNIAPGSADAATVGDTLSRCQASPLAGELRSCTTSLESTVRSATGMLGSAQERVYWAASSALPRAGLPLQPYVVQAVTPLDGDRHVGCHSMPYPYAVYYCHMTGRATKAYAVSLRSLRGGEPPVTMAALCHLETSDWDPAHPAFKMLHTQPGGDPVCHFMSYANLLFGVKAANA
jgi:hypothetical protein